MAAFALDPVLLRHGSLLGRTPDAYILLGHEAAVLWFMLVPETTAVELCELDAAAHAALFDEAHALGRALRARGDVDKLNVAAIGNLVRQLHLHVIGRRIGDAHWPGVVWGAPPAACYTAGALEGLRAWLATVFGARFTAVHDG